MRYRLGYRPLGGELGDVDHESRREDDQSDTDGHRFDNKHDRDGEGHDDRHYGDGLRPDRESKASSPISDDSAEQAVVDQPVVETFRRLGEEERREQNRSDGGDEWHGHTNERHPQEEEPEDEEDGSEHAALDNGHRERSVLTTCADSPSERQYIGTMAWLNRLFSRGGDALRVAGEPQSGNGASSFHLWWQVPAGERFTEIAATLEVVDEPIVERLVFWALQVSFVGPSGGGAHLGLQHHPNYPAASAANWGGYAPPVEGGLLDGSPSPLPSTPNDPNTRDFLWLPQRPYRLAVGRSPDPAPGGFFSWRGTITDTRSGEVSVVRDLYSRGQYLRSPVVWTESFARCEHPSFAVRWSDLSATRENGQPISITAVVVNYQDRSAGGCDNTNVSVDGTGWTQRTNVPRPTPPGARLSLPRSV